MAMESRFTLNGYRFDLGIPMCPQEFRVYETVGGGTAIQVAHVRVRFGWVEAWRVENNELTSLFYQVQISSSWVGEFQDDEQKARHLTVIADALNVIGQEGTAPCG